MKILFVYPNITGNETISHGIASLSSYLKKEGHETDLMDYTYGGNIDDCVKKVKNSKPDIIGFSLRSGEFSFCLAVAHALKKNFDLPILFGGVHPTIAPEECIEQEDVDMICIGEGELALAELLSRLARGEEILDIENFWIKEEDRIVKNPVRPLVEDLDELPPIDRQLFNFDKFIDIKAGEVDMMISRGCLFACTYCINPSLNELYKGSYRRIRYRSVNYVLDEITELAANYPVKSLVFNDDIFPPSIVWLREFVKKYTERFDIPFYCATRVELVRLDMCTLLKQANCKGIIMGIESGSEKIRKEVLNRTMTNDLIIRAFATAKEAGLAVSSFNMVGIPFETKNDIQQTIALNRIIKPNMVAVSTFTPYPGTQLRDLCQQKGWIKDCDNPNTYIKKSIMNYPYTSAREISWWRKTFRFKVLIKSNILKALVSLFFDMFYEVFSGVKRFMPKFLKTWQHKIVQWATSSYILH